MISGMIPLDCMVALKRSVNLGTIVLAAALSEGLSAPGAPAPETNWPQFRGPNAQGISTNANLPEHWSATENVAWIAEHEWKVLCLDLASGKVRWEHVVHRGPPAGPTHLKNSYASETPVTDGERVYACVGGVGLFCLDFSGREVWSKLLEPHKMRASWGTASSPVLHRDRLYFVNDNEEQSYLLALDKRSGKEIWRVDRDEKSNWSTPYVWENEQRCEIVTAGTGKVRSYDL